MGKEAVDSLLDVSAGNEIEQEIRSIVKKKNIEMKSLKTQRKGSAITANLEIRLPGSLTVEEAAKDSNSLREALIREIDRLQYVAIQIDSHKIETGFYKPELGRGFGWQRKGRFSATSAKTARALTPSYLLI